MGIFLSFLRHKSPSSHPQSIQISHPYPLGTHPEMDYLSEPEQSSIFRRRGREQVGSVRRALSTKSTRSARSHSAQSPQATPRRRHSHSRPDLRHRGSHGPRDPPEEISRLLSASPDSDPTSVSSPTDASFNSAATTSTARNIGRLRKVLRVEGDWDVVREGDWEGFRVDLGHNERRTNSADDGDR